MPAALVPRPWDFDLPPGTPDLIPIHETGPLEQVPPREKTEDESSRPSGDLPPISFHDDPVPAPPSSESDSPGTDNETMSPPSVTIIPPTLRSTPLGELQVQA